MYDFYKEKCNYNIAAIIVIGVLLFTGWLYYDAHRNAKQHNDTDRTVERIESGLDNIGRGIDSLQSRVTEAKKTVGKTEVRIRESRKDADTIIRGIGEAEQRLDNAIQASGRVKNRIADIEAANR